MDERLLSMYKDFNENNIRNNKRPMSLEEFKKIVKDFQEVGILDNNYGFHRLEGGSILQALTDHGFLNVSQISKLTDLSKQSVIKELKKLLQANQVVVEKKNGCKYYTISPTAL